MGISVPIGAEHYDKLKAISEKLGLGLKKTMEYLVSYYWQKEIGQSARSKKVKPDIDESREEDTPVVQSKEVEPIVQSIEVKPIRQLLEELSKEYDLLPSNEITIDSLLAPQKATSYSTIAKEEDPMKAKSTLWPKEMVQTCSCGSLKKPNAKYCYNCGSIL